MIVATPQPIRCDVCHTYLMAVEGGDLVIRSRHHGEQHVTRVPLDDLLAETAVSAPGRMVVRYGDLARR